MSLSMKCYFNIRVDWSIEIIFVPVEKYSCKFSRSFWIIIYEMVNLNKGKYLTWIQKYIGYEI